MTRYICAAIVIFLASAFAVADEEDNVGRIDYVHSEYLDVVIDDSVFTFALNLKVFDLKGRAVNRYALKPGAQVRYEFIRLPNGQRQLSSIWLVSDTSR